MKDSWEITIKQSLKKRVEGCKSEPRMLQPKKTLDNQNK